MAKIKTYKRGNLHFASITADGEVYRSQAYSAKELALDWVKLKVNALGLPVAWDDTIHRFVTIPQD